MPFPRDLILVWGFGPALLAFAAGAWMLGEAADTLSRPAIVLIALGMVVPTTLAAALAVLKSRQHRRDAEAAQALDRDKQWLLTAIDNMSQGLTLFDGSERIVLCNRRYLEMYGLAADAIKPGSSFHDLIRYRHATGSIIAEPEEFRERALALTREGRPFVWETADGRFIEVSSQMLPGGGWVAIHADITVQRNAKVALEQNWTFLNNIIDNIPIAIIVKDAVDRQVTLINRAGEDLWGVSREQALGKSARDVFPNARADTIDKFDEAAIAQNGPITLPDHSNLARSPDTRVVTSRRLALRDRDGKPEHIVSLVEDVTEKRMAELKIVHLAHHDPLTDLPNRILFRERLEAALAALSDGESLAVLCLDLDDFKNINDTLGHPTGDELLKAVAARLRNCLAPGDTICRLGGDEFAIVQTSVRPGDVLDLLAAIHTAMRDPCEAEGHQLTAQASIGVALAPVNGREPDELLKNADLALYAAKADGRGTFRFFDAGMGAHAKNRQALEADLQTALANNEFELLYQPVVSTRDNQIVGCEALLRWRHPKRGMINPVEFIPIAEDTGLINQIGEWVLQTACREAATWPKDFKIAVNVSAVQFRSQTFPFKVVNALTASGLAPSRLELELTETVLMRDDEAALAMLDQLRGIGVKIAMDDFGTGYSSLRYLHRFPFDKIKIDRSFISDLAERDGSMPIVRAIINIAHSRKIITTAEGVETEAQRGILRRVGCTEMQGYLFSAPKRPDEIKKLQTWSTAAAAARRRAS